LPLPPHPINKIEITERNKTQNDLRITLSSLSVIFFDNQLSLPRRTNGAETEIAFDSIKCHQIGYFNCLINLAQSCLPVNFFERALNSKYCFETVKRNIGRFSDDFILELPIEECDEPVTVCDRQVLKCHDKMLMQPTAATTVSLDYSIKYSII